MSLKKKPYLSEGERDESVMAHQQPAVRRLPAATEDAKQQLERKLEELERVLQALSMKALPQTELQTTSHAPRLTSQASEESEAMSKSRIRRLRRQKAKRRRMAEQQPGRDQRQPKKQPQLQVTQRMQQNIGSQGKIQPPVQLPRGRRRRDALLVVCAPGVQYVDMYIPVRSSEALQDIQQYILKGRRMSEDSLRMELSQEADSAEVCRRIREVLGDRGTVKLFTQMAEVVIRKIDCLTEEECIKKAIKEYLAKETNIQSFRMWELKDGTKRARVRLPRVDAEQLNQRRIKMGYFKSCVELVPREDKASKRCFRCLERGHLAQQCRGVDRTDTCIRCGKTGHKAACCERPVCCIRCGDPHRIAARECKELATRR